MTSNSAVTCLVLAVFLYAGNCSPWREWGNYSYFISDRFDINLKLNYTDASLYCQNLSSHLASVHSHDETEFIKANTRTIESAWFGLHHIQPALSMDCKCDGCLDTEELPSPDCENCLSCRGPDKWQWEDGTEYDWTNWHFNQPSDFNNEMCANFHGDGKWYDAVCSYKINFICKRASNCYPHFCNSKGICEDNVCVCASGYTGETCDMESSTISLTTDTLSAVSSTGNHRSTSEEQSTRLTTLSNCLQMIYASESSQIICSNENQTAALASLGILLGISLLLNIVLITKLVLERRDKHNPRYVAEQENVYYNSVTQSSIPLEGPKRASPVNTAFDQSTGNVNRQDIQDHYEKLKATDITTPSREITAYAMLN